jgi:nucleotide-binding universal stress UspA family protein
MYHKMLVLLDGSKTAEVVLGYAQQLSARLNISLELLHVCSPQEAEQLPVLQAYLGHLAESLSKKAAEIRASIGDQSAGPEVKAQAKVLVGYPAEEILHYADHNNIDIIMLSTHGRSGIRVWDIGNVANKVIHASKVSILMVPSGISQDAFYDKLPKRNMIVPLDGTRLSESVIPHAVSLARQTGAKFDITFVHVDDPHRRPSGEKTDITSYLNNIVAQIEYESINAGAVLLKGDTAETLVNFIENNPAHLVVMSTHAHKGLTTMVFSSVTESVMHMVKKAPVLIVKQMELP